MTNETKSKIPTWRTVKTFFCRCDHIDVIHGDKGTGICEGVYTYFDRMGSPDPFPVHEPCPCQKFEAAP